MKRKQNRIRRRLAFKKGKSPEKNSPQKIRHNELSPTKKKESNRNVRFGKGRKHHNRSFNCKRYVNKGSKNHMHKAYVFSSNKPRTPHNTTQFLVHKFSNKVKKSQLSEEDELFSLKPGGTMTNSNLINIEFFPGDFYELINQKDHNPVISEYGILEKQDNGQNRVLYEELTDENSHSNVDKD